MEVSDWYCKALFYILDVNGKTKFGITNNWDRRLVMYHKEFPDLPIKLIKMDSYGHYWQVELVENVVRRRLKKWTLPGTHEWVRSDLTIQNVIDCYNQVRELLEKEYDEHEHIHKEGKHRYAYYREIYNMHYLDEF